MTRIATVVLAVLALAGPAPAVAGGKPADSRRPQPSSYAPRPHSSDHVYGSPIETGGVTPSPAPRDHNTPAPRDPDPPAQPRAKPKKHHAPDRKTKSGRPAAGSQHHPG